MKLQFATGVAIFCAALMFFSPVVADPVPNGDQMINALRKQVGAKSLRHSPKLQAAAEAHGRDMVANGFFDHKGSNGGTVGSRVTAQGYRFCYVSENIASGFRDMSKVVEGWSHSPGHRKNMLNKKARDYGFAVVGGNMWVLVLGKDGC